jgi:hypothetical protein
VNTEVAPFTSAVDTAKTVRGTETVWTTVAAGFVTRMVDTIVEAACVTVAPA